MPAPIATGLRNEPSTLQPPIGVTTASLTSMAAAVVGVTSSLIPYVCDRLVMRKTPRASYALAVSLLPATATVVGLVVLPQIRGWRDLLGVALVVIGAGIRDPRTRIAADVATHRGGFRQAVENQVRSR
jgi:threonine/homoserine efflux transporter RhtA